MGWGNSRRNNRTALHGPGGATTRHATSVRQGNWVSLRISPVPLSKIRSWYIGHSVGTGWGRVRLSALPITSDVPDARGKSGHDPMTAAWVAATMRAGDLQARPALLKSASRRGGAGPQLGDIPGPPPATRDIGGRAVLGTARMASF